MGVRDAVGQWVAAVVFLFYFILFYFGGCGRNNFSGCGFSFSYL